MAELDRLEVQVEAQAAAANRQLDTLISKLNKVANAMSGIKIPSGLNGQIGQTSSSMSAILIGAKSSNAGIESLHYAIL